MSTPQVSNPPSDHPSGVPSGVPTKTIGTRNPSVQYTPRTAVRAIITSPDGSRVLVVKASKENYYKLPGGGVEEGEDHLKAAEREVKEETGHGVEIKGGVVGVTEEWRGGLHQVSYCYRGWAVEGEMEGGVELTEEEVEDGLGHEWIAVGEVLTVMGGVVPTSELGRFIQERDLFLMGLGLGLGSK